MQAVTTFAPHRAKQAVKLDICISQEPLAIGMSTRLFMVIRSSKYLALLVSNFFGYILLASFFLWACVGVLVVGVWDDKPRARSV